MLRTMGREQFRAEHCTARLGFLDGSGDGVLAAPAWGGLELAVRGAGRVAAVG
uniref:Uncharacterized protein n=1 Tax=Arundo donax TaxID=35708 RepID=A0A0A8Z3P2_ARUDO